MVRVLDEVALEHVPFPAAVKVNVTLPAAISAVLGVYVAVVSEFALANAPVPFEVDHVTPPVFVALDPAVIFTAPASVQVDTAVPATAVGAAVIVKVLLEVAS